MPGLYEWVTAARGVGDDNLAWELFDAARTYPWQEEQAEIETARIEGSELDLGTRKIRLSTALLPCQAAAGSAADPGATTARGSGRVVAGIRCRGPVLPST